MKAGGVWDWNWGFRMWISVCSGGSKPVCVWAGIEVRGYKLKLGVLGYRLKVMCEVGIAIRGLNKVFIRI